MVRGASANSLAPGFRFHPTDEELVRYYLKRKVTSKPIRFDHIAVIDIYKFEPWDLPDKSKLKSRDLEWYFFSSLDKKYGNGSKTNRATEKGYWKTTGKDRPIRFNSQTVGMKKTLVYHQGRAPRGARSNWVMHEYRLADEELEKAGVAQDLFVLCRVFQKSGTGPKNGEQYGAPFIEEEWDDDEEVALLPGDNTLAADEMIFGDNEYVEIDDLEQNFDVGIDTNNGGLPLNFYHGETSNEGSARIINAPDQQLIMRPENQFIPDGSDDQNLVNFIRPRNQFIPNVPGDQNLVNLPGPVELDGKSVNENYVAESSNNANADFNYLVEEPYFDASSDPAFDGRYLLEANDPLNNVEPDSTRDSAGFDMLEEYLSFFDAGDDNLTFDLSELMGVERTVADQLASAPKGVNGGIEEMTMASQTPLAAHDNGGDEASSSNRQPEAKMPLNSDIKYQFLKQASHMLGNIPAPPAFASEFPVKDKALRINPAHGSTHVTASMMRIENILPSHNGIDWSVGKNGTVNVILSFSLPLNDTGTGSSSPIASLFSGKMGSMMSRSWFFAMFLLVLILSVGYKFGVCMYTK